MQDKNGRYGQTALGGIAKRRGKSIAEWGEGSASDMLEEEKDNVKRKRYSTSSGYNYTRLSDEDTGPFASEMESSMSKELESRRKKDGKPTGYDAAMRGVVKPKKKSPPASKPGRYAY